MSNHRREERKKEIIILKQQGFDAAAAGKSIHSCPREYLHNMNRRHWEEGFLSFVPEKPEPYQIPELNSWDFPDTKLEPDGYNFKEVPVLSGGNFKVLVEKINEIICFINSKERGK